MKKVNKIKTDKKPKEQNYIDKLIEYYKNTYAHIC